MKSYSLVKRQFLNREIQILKVANADGSVSCIPLSLGNLEFNNFVTELNSGTAEVIDSDGRLVQTQALISSIK